MPKFRKLKKKESWKDITFTPIVKEKKLRGPKIKFERVRIPIITKKELRDLYKKRQRIDPEKYAFPKWIHTWVPPQLDVGFVKKESLKLQDFKKYSKVMWNKKGEEALAVGILVQTKEGGYKIYKIENLEDTERSPKSGGVRSGMGRITNTAVKLGGEVQTKYGKEAKMRVLVLHSHPPGYPLEKSHFDVTAEKLSLSPEVYPLFGPPIMGITHPGSEKIAMYDGKKKIKVI